MAVQLIFFYYSIREKFSWFRKRMRIFLCAVFVIWYVDCLPEKLFNDSTSTVLLDRDGQLLGAHISKDEQWRFEECDSVPYKFKKCIVEFEDRNFYNHFGVSIKGVGRALIQNFRSGRRVSGGSTLTMQLVRLMRKNPKRTYTEKLFEMLLATRIEFSYSKDEILRLYSSHAPFGNNVVGLDAASWRFFGRPAYLLSWSESATLAVLPNAPGLIYPGKNHKSLLVKRNRLLKRLLEVGELNQESYEIAILEPLPDRPHSLPSLAPHLLTKFMLSNERGRTVNCSLMKEKQKKVNQLLENHMSLLRENKIFNGAVVVTSVKTGEIVAYVGNSIESGREHSNQVNCVPASRSTGSILKPILYAKAIESGQITPKALLFDVPSKFGGFAPKNFAGSFDGLIPADQALSRSLNIPMVHLLNRYGVAKFHSDLKELGFSTLNMPAKHYGLSLILGGAEVSLMDLSNVYTQMAQKLQSNSSSNISYELSGGTFDERIELPIDKACIYSAFEAMLEVKRPDEDNNWKMFSSSQKIAWKTGTSFGFRDAWAVGVTPDYVVSVWIGNADGEGRPGLTGVTAAAPLLFEIFNQLPRSKEWFRKPMLLMKKVEICSQSGHRSTPNCPEVVRLDIPKISLESQGCPYHRIIHLDNTGEFRVDSECASPESMQHVPWFIIPSSIEKFYKEKNPDYQSLPAYMTDCSSKTGERSLAIIYPRNKQKIYLPIDFNEERGKVIFEGAHRNGAGIIFWHLDNVFFGQTIQIHQLEFQPSIGKHKLTLVDENGVTASVWFEVLGKEK